jgi:hypothetical protein
MARFNLIVDDDAPLEDLARDTRRSSKADVVRDALSLYQFLLRKAQDGERIFVGPDKEQAAEVAVTTFDHALRQARKAAER